jgi:hypothetical protein
VKKVLVVLVASMVGVAALEVGFRIFKPFLPVGVRRAFEYDPDMGYRLKSSLNLTRLTDHLAEVHTNRLGTANYQEDFEGYPALVFAVGDSYTMGTGLPPDASYPFQLDLILNRDEKGLYRKRYGVVNLGVSGTGAEQHLRQLRRYASRLGKPAIVLYLGCDNDFMDDLLFRNGSRHTYGVEGNPHYGPFLWLRQAMGWTDLGQRLLYRWSAARDRRLLRQALGVENWRLSPRPIAELQAPMLEKIAAATRDQGARLVVSWADANESYPLLKSWAAAKNISFADWKPAMDSVQHTMPALPHWNPHSGIHYRTWVNRLIAEAYAREIERLI